MFKKLLGIITNPDQVIRLGRSVGEPIDPHNGMVARGITDLYYECNAYTDDPYWGIWPKPVRYMVSLPAWMPISAVLVPVPNTLKHEPLTYRRLGEYRRADGRGATPDELKQIWDDNEMRDKRINPTKPITFDIEVGLNPIGVRRFFEENVFSHPPVIPLTPALLKPYTLRRVIISNPNPAPNVNVVHYPIFTGVWRGDTCAGPVFDNMMIRGERGSYPPAFETTEDRNAFFLKICELLIDGIIKDDGDATLCENHGNFGECLIGLFDPSSPFAFHPNPVLKNRVIMLLFHKMIEVNEELKIILSMNKLPHNLMANASSNSSNAYLERSMSHLKPQIPLTAPIIRLFDRYYNIAVSIMQKYTLNVVNPLNVELCAATFAHSDGKTMAHLLAEKHPLFLQKLMEDPLQHFNKPDNPIAYLIPDATGQTPKRIAVMRACTAVNQRVQGVQGAQGVCEFFRLLPDPQVGPVHVDRTNFEKLNAPPVKSMSIFNKLFGRGGTRRNGTRRNGTRRNGTRRNGTRRNGTGQIKPSKKSRRKRTTSHRRRSRAAR